MTQKAQMVLVLGVLVAAWVLVWVLVLPVFRAEAAREEAREREEGQRWMRKYEWGR
jgi:hypothetical protein